MAESTQLWNLWEIRQWFHHVPNAKLVETITNILDTCEAAIVSDMAADLRLLRSEAVVKARIAELYPPPEGPATYGATYGAPRAAKPKPKRTKAPSAAAPAES